jgi:hypothetical protein
MCPFGLRWNLLVDGYRTFISGPLLNFVATNSVLRTGPKQRIYYDPKEPANAYLGGSTYWLPQLDGSPGGGALSGPPGGTVIMLK